ncbi:UBX domain-containing protein 10-like [Denticeps clupeoides]|uniref:UBX domain-containing protein 10-like n=1 Tax=Denticeps clupeoides TaxID=299321 RepID=UPI0010A2F5E3|nr:UBX domain-containing protein 10-like [Denticeps clupeoides]
METSETVSTEMHMSRPKSSKGRSRPLLRSQSGNSAVFQAGAATPRPPSLSRDPCPPSHGLRRASGASGVQDTVTSRPLNKYRVLPSIEKKLMGSVEEKILPEARQHLTSQSNPEMVCSTPGSSEEQASLTLAVRAPCGSRFEHRFRPGSTLQSVVAAAEARLGREYQGVLIRTMDRPGRTFTDMSLTLAQCGVLSRSVLCIAQDQNIEDPNILDY